LVDLLPLTEKQTDGFLPEFLCLVEKRHNPSLCLNMS
jgi:hypothetical protein